MPTGKTIRLGTPLSIDFKYVRRAEPRELALLHNRPPNTVWHFVRRRPPGDGPGAGEGERRQVGLPEFAIGFTPAPRKNNRWTVIVRSMPGVSGFVNDSAIENLADLLGMSKKAERWWAIPRTEAEHKAQEGMTTEQARTILEGLGFRRQGDDDNSYGHSAFGDMITLPDGNHIGPGTQRLIKAAIEKLGRNK